jgi:hypothetical protein
MPPLFAAHVPAYRALQAGAGGGFDAGSCPLFGQEVVMAGRPEVFVRGSVHVGASSGAITVSPGHYSSGRNSSGPFA